MPLVRDALKAAALLPAVAITAPLAFGGMLVFVAMLSAGAAREPQR